MSLKICKSMMKIHSKETLAKMKETRKLNSKPFEAFDKNGNCVGEWNIMADCARDIFDNVNQYSGIAQCLKGVFKQYKGYTFKYKENIVNEHTK